MRGLDALCTLALLVPACAGSQRPDHLTAEELEMAPAVEAVVYGGVPEVRIADVQLARTSAGAVRAVRVGARGAPARDPREDASVEAAVRGRLAIDPMVAAIDLDVDADQGVVRLAGDVARPEEAVRAMRLALDTPGVVSVISSLAWVSTLDDLRLAGRKRPAAR